MEKTIKLYCQKYLQMIKINIGSDIFAPDYLNTGFGGKAASSYTITDETNELAQITNGFRAENVIIVTHSIGGQFMHSR